MSLPTSNFFLPYLTTVMTRVWQRMAMDQIKPMACSLKHEFTVHCLILDALMGKDEEQKAYETEMSS